ncbi:uncharacterized protein EV422DRAFT_523749 [Fimicolochytrium jonesii]|uniref:uncharacterized protein n=1 Tax=Fimicolochytrium jonesii TaxID=1396493 RepID=UPI0022FF4333|nr:uncharacterized protein EV422DRAFT_523749 [Fimicolochytrium jonesii]KAI8822371.1 hypothetical protein EV422DRAFT_523749 [Fimicolochytrium jonesii]
MESGRVGKRYRHSGDRCCCFPSFKHFCCFCCLIILLILAAIGIALGLLWPKVPANGHGNPYVAESADGFTAVLPKDVKNGTSTWAPGVLPRFPTSPTSGFGFSVGAGLDVWADNQNKYAIAADKVTATGTINDISGQPIDTSKFRIFVDMVDVSFPKGRNTTVKIPIQIIYNGAITDLVGTDDKVLQLLSSSCNTPILNYQPNGNSPPLAFKFDVQISPEVFKFVSIPISFGPLNFACPDSLKTQLGVLSKTAEPFVKVLGAAGTLAGGGGPGAVGAIASSAGVAIPTGIPTALPAGIPGGAVPTDLGAAASAIGAGALPTAIPDLAA